MRPGDRLRLAIEKPAAGGRMIARHDGAIVLVSGAIPGEAVEAVVERVQRGTIWARATTIAEPSPDRVGAADDGACGGNVFAHVRYERQLALKANIVRDAFTRIGRLALPGDLFMEASASDGYRLRARLHVQRGRIGFYREGTHTLCDAASTRQLLPAAIEALDHLQTSIGSIPGIDGTEVELSENVPATERALHVVLPRASLGPQLRRLPAIGGVTGISSSVPDSPRVLTLAGSTLLRDTLEVPSAIGPLTVAIERRAQAFFQGNRFLLTSLLSSAAALVPAGRVLDLYAGVGPFAMTLAARGDCEIVAVEGEATAAGDLAANARRSDGRVTVRHRAVESFLAAAPPEAIDTTIVDPPRTGLSKEATAGLVAMATGRLVYVSCDVATAARDARLLVDSGYRLSSVRAFDMFPNTAHVETLMLFER